MVKQFHRFEAKVPEDFEEQMIKFWMKDENVTREEAMGFYHDDDFKSLCSRLSGGGIHAFNPDLGYTKRDIDGTLCFEWKDNNFVIPVSILEVV